MQQKLQENPLIAPLLMDAHTLVGATSGVSSDEELDEHLKNLHAPDAIKHLIEILISNMSDELKVTATHP